MSKIMKSDLTGIYYIVKRNGQKEEISIDVITQIAIDVIITTENENRYISFIKDNKKYKISVKEVE